MDYEKNYNEALERAKTLYENANGMILKKWVEQVFPELKDSEDETIRKRLIEYFKDFRLGTFAGLEPKKIIAWLEKQGEPTDINPSEFDSRLNALLKQFEDLSKDDIACSPDFYLNVVQNDDTYKEEKQVEQELAVVIPKFKVGDWIIFNGLTLYIKEIVKGYYRTISKGGITNSYDWGVDNTARLWTVQDAKDGDVLSNGKMIVIFKHFEEPSYRQHIVAYIGLDTNGDIQITDDTWNLGIDKTKPATKEQRDLLFAKMKEAGYEWDAEKKEPKNC